jgi:hypothetical protein
MANARLLIAADEVLARGNWSTIITVKIDVWKPPIWTADAPGTGATNEQMKAPRGAFAFMPRWFSEGTHFADVEGVPVSLTPDYECRAWDVPNGRRFNVTSFSHNGTLVTEERFRELALWAQPSVLDAEPFWC